MLFEGWAVGDVIDTGVLVVVAVMVITRKLVWYKDLRREEARTLRWEKIALDALGVADKMTSHGEVTNAILTQLPDPAKDEKP